ARMRDATAFVVTDIDTGFQELMGLWERPDDAEDEWEVPESEVSEKLSDLMARFRVQRVYCDPPHWNNTVGEWSVRYGYEVQEWWTNRTRPMVNAIGAYVEAIDTGRVSHNGDPRLSRHIGNAGRRQTNLVDERGERLWILTKLHPTRKFDAAMAAMLSWQARMDVVNKPPDKKRGRRAARIR